MSTLAEYQSITSSREPNRPGSSYARVDTTAGEGAGSTINRVITAPLWMTAAGLNWMTSSMQRFTDNLVGGSGPATNGSAPAQATSGRDNKWAEWANPLSWVSSSPLPGDQSLGGDDLKYVTWSIIFTKPGYEALLEPMQHDLLAYATDSSSYAAMKIAKFIEGARFGRVERPRGWVEHHYPEESSAGGKRESSSKSESSKQDHAKGEKDGWRIPGEDQKYLQFLYRVEWRVPRRDADTAHVERVTVERTPNAHARIVV